MTEPPLANLTHEQKAALDTLGMEAAFDWRCWTCGQGYPIQPTSLCNEAHDAHNVLVGAQVPYVEHP